MKIVPIALFVYNRLVHTRQTVEALAANEYASVSELFVFSDGPRNEDDKDKVQMVREYLHTITGFTMVTVVEREHNFGCARSIISGVTEIVNKYGQVIVVEDDVVTAPYFLRYMNEALDLYQDKDRVACIHGYLYPVTEKMPATFFLRGADIWGWGTWKRAWDLYEYDAKKLLIDLKNQHLTKSFDMGGFAEFTELLKSQARGDINTWDIQWHASAFLHNKLTLYPGKSLVKNIGFDNSGTHTSTSNQYDVGISHEPVTLEPIPLEEDVKARKAVESYWRRVRPSMLKRTYIRMFKRFKSLYRRVLLPD